VIALLLLAMAPQGVEITVREPYPARYSQQSVTFRCGRDLLEINGYGLSRPEGRPPRVRLNGRVPAGADLPQLLRDLAHPRAAYRFTAHCDSDGRPGFFFRLYRGESVRGTDVEYYIGNGWFTGGRLRSYTGRRSYAESFWSH
jgi:hypothetical protein